jgi:hypothetical protein
MVHWVYVLKSSTSGAIYVGETTRLYRRWNEHRTGRGGVTTSRDDYDTLIGLYNVSHNIGFLDYYRSSEEQTHDWNCVRLWDEEVDRCLALEVENHITERYMKEYKHRSVHGGKYCKSNVCNLGSVVVDRPLCMCGYPCEVNMKNDKTKMYFTCPIPEWTTFDDMNTPAKCKFWKEFEPFRVLNEKTKKDYVSKKRAENLALFIQMTDE